MSDTKEKQTRSVVFHLPTTVPQISKLAFAGRLSYTRDRFQDLDLFRNEITQSKAGLHHLPYTTQKRNVFFYRLVFLGFTLLFCILAMVATYLPTTINLGLLLSSCTFLKTGVIAISSLLAFASLALALSLKAEKEAIAQCIHRTKQQLKSTLVSKQLKMGPRRFFFAPQRFKAAALYQIYQEKLDRINDKKNEVLHLSHRILTAETLDNKEKESLLNQALEEFEETLHLLVHAFKQNHATSID